MTTVCRQGDDVTGRGMSGSRKDAYWSYMAKPKPIFTGWYTEYQSRPRELWGTQQMMNPISKAALSAEATERIKTLARPKVDHQQANLHRPLYDLSIGRPSTIWFVSPMAKKAEASKRVKQLACHKDARPEFLENENRPSYTYSCGRVSTIWDVRPATVSGTIRNPDHVDKIATPKATHPLFQPNRSARSVVAEQALSANATERLQQLAEPKKRMDTLIRDPQWKVSQAAKNATVSKRSMELSSFKMTVDDYQPDRACPMPVPYAALTAISSPRMQQLATPVSRSSMDHVQFNPDAFKVKESALKGVIPRRVLELARPIER